MGAKLMGAKHRYNMEIPDHLWKKLQQIAKEDGISIREVMIRLIKVGVILHQVDGEITITTSGKKRSIIIV